MICPYYFRVQRFPANTTAGYHADFYLYVSAGAGTAAQNGSRQILLVQPNNSGTNSDDPDVHRRDVFWTGWERQKVADEPTSSTRMNWHLLRRFLGGTWERGIW